MRTALLVAALAAAGAVGSSATAGASLPPPAVGTGSHSAVDGLGHGALLGAPDGSSSARLSLGEVQPGAAPPSPGRYGKFLHITDLHPDPHYTRGSKVAEACHISRKKEKQRHGGKFPPGTYALWTASWLGSQLEALLLGAQSQGRREGDGDVRTLKSDKAGHFGAPGSICDAPPSLITASLRWVSDNWLPQAGKKEVRQAAQGDSMDGSAGRGLDFVLVTGDLARHDVDAQHYPRTLPEIYASNRWTMEQIERAFPGVPIVPCVGNNDIFPHNIMFGGPSAVTRELAAIWAKHIPEFEVHNFQRGAYFAKEVIPNELAVLSLNTIYMYDSNKVVDGCVRSKKKKPEKDRDAGTLMLDWMEVQLLLFRSRGMQVHIMGHVPPTAGNYFPLCYERYTEIVLRYQDTIVGQHFGHMNVDAFFIQEDEEAVMSPFNATTKDQQVSSLLSHRHRHNGEVHTSALADDLQDDYATLPGRKRTNLDYYHAFFVSPSIVPTFLPTLRVFTYNTTQSAKRVIDLEARKAELDLAALQRRLEQEVDDDEAEDEEDGDDTLHVASRNHRRRHRKHKKKKHRRKKLPRHASPDAPARTNTYLSLLGFSQWVLDLDRANAEWEKAQEQGREGGVAEGKGEKKGARGVGKGVEFELEYATYEPETLWRPYLLDSAGSSSDAAADVSIPVPKALLDRYLARKGVQPPRYDADGHHTAAGRRLACAFERALAWTWLSRGGAAVRTPCDSAAHDAAGMAKRDNKSNQKKKLRLPKPIKHLTDYSMDSLTVEPMMELARRLATDRKLWKRFTGRMYQGLPGGR